MFVPEECYEDFGSDLDGCSTQENEGCGRCNYRKRKEKEYIDSLKLFKYQLPTSMNELKCGFIQSTSRERAVEKIKEFYELVKVRVIGIDYFYDKMIIEEDFKFNPDIVVYVGKRTINDHACGLEKLGL
jgi:hypothetical protein